MEYISSNHNNQREEQSWIRIKICLEQVETKKIQKKRKNYD